MSLHINRFVDRLRATESRRQPNMSMTIQEARDLHSDITKLLLVMEQLREQSVSSGAEVITVEVKGGSFTG
jgi:hypothetical protein